MKPRLSTPAFTLLVLTAASIAMLIFYGADLPPTVAVHFGEGGRADGFQDRVMFIVMRSFWTMMLPPVVAAMGLLPRIFNLRLNVPNREYWLASPARRDEANDRLLWFSLWFACLLQAFLFANQGLVMFGNATQPASLPALTLVMTVAVLVPAIAILMGLLFRSFAAPRP
jgi:hypothetical protein